MQPSRTTLLLTLSALSLHAADWPSWRGPKGDGIAPEKVADAFPAEGPRTAWKAKVGTGYASMSVAGGRLYTLGNPNKGDVATLWCLDIATGKPVWSKEYPSELKPMMYDGGANAAPTVADGKVYAIIKPGRLVCLDAATGTPVWDKELVKELEAESNPWGVTSAPQVRDGKILLNVGTHGTALDAATGKVLWSTGKGGHSFSSPVLAKVAGEDAVMVFATNHLAAVRLKDGSELFQHPFGKGYFCHVADPIVQDGAVFISSNDAGGEQLRFAGGKPESVWKGESIGCFTATPVLIGGHLYGVNGSTFKAAMLELRCVDWKTGQVKWSEKGFGQGNLVGSADGKLLVLSETGELSLVKANPEKFELLGRAQVLGGKCWTSPVVANGRLYARNTAGDLVSVDVSPAAVN